jgi:hypothetical protein
VTSPSDEPPPEAQVRAFFERLIDKVVAHPRYGAAVRSAVDEGRELVLNYHTHGEGHGWCVSICTRGAGVALLDLGEPLEELAHIRGIAKEEALCDPLMGVFAERLIERFSLASRPRIYLNGAPRT